MQVSTELCIARTYVTKTVLVTFNMVIPVLSDYLSLMMLN